MRIHSTTEREVGRQESNMSRVHKKADSCWRVVVFPNGTTRVTIGVLKQPFVDIHRWGLWH